MGRINLGVGDTPRARFARWMQDDALPLWSSDGLSPDGGVVERFDLAGAPERPGFKRVRVHARQAYVFSHAHVIGLPGMLEPARAAIDYLTRHGRADTGLWVTKMGESGGIVDPDHDLYDQAFVILALAWWAKASGNASAIDLAIDTLSSVTRVLSRPDGRGFFSRHPDSGEALQNPHMHLLEALLALHEVAPQSPAEQGIATLLNVFHTALFDPGTGTLGEVFAMDWQPAPGAAGQIVEPGHHYEWVWLLHMAQRAGFGPAEPYASRLHDFSEAHGLCHDTALIHDSTNRTGQVTSQAHRSWPQTERIKALIVRAEATGQDTGPEIDAALAALHRYYLDPAPRPGTWIDHVDNTGAPKVSAIPASTLYHLFLAYAELVRAAPRNPASAGPEAGSDQNKRTFPDAC